MPAGHVEAFENIDIHIEDRLNELHDDDAQGDRAGNVDADGAGLVADDDRKYVPALDKHLSVNLSLMLKLATSDILTDGKLNALTQAEKDTFHDKLLVLEQGLAEVVEEACKITDELTAKATELMHTKDQPESVKYAAKLAADLGMMVADPKGIILANFADVFFKYNATLYTETVTKLNDFYAGYIAWRKEDDASFDPDATFDIFIQAKVMAEFQAIKGAK